jgi:hypothetical protein
LGRSRLTTEPGTYPCGQDTVEVTPGDIKLAEGNPDAVFTAIHPDFFAAEAPYLLTGVELPTKSQRLCVYLLGAYVYFLRS